MRQPQARFVVTVATITLVLAAVLPVLAQQQALDHDDVLQWNTIDDPSLSPDGNWLAFALAPMEGDPALTLTATSGDGPALTVRGSGPTFTSDSRHLVYAVPAPESEVDALKREGKEGEELPQDAPRGHGHRCRIRWRRGSAPAGPALSVRSRATRSRAREAGSRTCR